MDKSILFWIILILLLICGWLFIRNVNVDNGIEKLSPLWASDHQCEENGEITPIENLIAHCEFDCKIPTPAYDKGTAIPFCENDEIYCKCKISIWDAYIKPLL